MFSICAPHTPKGGEELEAGGGSGWEAGKGFAPSALQFVGAVRCNPNRMGCPHIKGMGAAPPGMGKSRRMQECSAQGAWDLQVARGAPPVLPSPGVGLLLPLTSAPWFGVCRKQSGHGAGPV